jgi:hypothetical protein
VPPQAVSEVSFEQWKHLTNTWLATLAKCAIAALALHYSGLAVPLLAAFGYAPAQGAPAQSASPASAIEPTAHSPAPAAAMLAASSVMPVAPVSPVPPIGAAIAEGEPAAGAQWQRTSQRETGSTAHASARRNGAKLAHKSKLTRSGHSNGSRSASATSTAASAGPNEPQTELTRGAQSSGSRSASASAAAVELTRPAQSSGARSAGATPASTAPATAEPELESSATEETLMAAASSAEAEPLTAAGSTADEDVGEATVRINSRPWSQVYVDGTLVGHTPKLDLRVSAGNHRIRLVNPELRLSKTIALHAVAGETVSQVVLLDE